MSVLHLDNVSKAYATGATAVDHVSLTVQSGEFLVLVGPSGCGKTTLLRMLAGLEGVSAGSIRIGDKDVTHTAPRKRDIAMVFQNYALYPQLSVRENILFALKLRRTRRADREERLRTVADMLALDGLLDRKPGELSGGQRQRVAIGRAIVRQPKIYLMDEPLSNLDTKLRAKLRGELIKLHARLRVTTVYVTHDQTEAMTLGDRVAVMRDGRIVQCGTPEDLFSNPDDLFVASFLGTPPMNFVPATVSGGTVSFGGHRLQVPGVTSEHDGEVIVGMRPTDLRVASSGAAGSLISGRIEVVERLGAASHVTFPIEIRSGERVAELEEEEEADSFLLSEDDRVRITIAIPDRATYHVGDEITVAMDPDAFIVFDSVTGRRLTPDRAISTPVAAA